MIAAVVIGGAVAQWPLGYLSDKLGRRRTLAGSALAGAAIGIAIVVVFVIYQSWSADLQPFIYFQF